MLTSVVPSGFEAYARLLHPIEDPWSGVVRWAQVAAWSGLRLERDTQFADIAFPTQEPIGSAPWSGQDPSEGQLDTAGLTALSVGRSRRGHVHA